MQNIQNGKYVMPAFQRQYVWNMEQIEKLWDSILPDYPVATFFEGSDDFTDEDYVFMATMEKDNQVKANAWVQISLCTHAP